MSKNQKGELKLLACVTGKTLEDPILEPPVKAKATRVWGSLVKKLEPVTQLLDEMSVNKQNMSIAKHAVSELSTEQIAKLMEAEEPLVNLEKALHAIMIMLGITMENDKDTPEAHKGHWAKIKAHIVGKEQDF